jgi:dipeptidase E
MKLVFYSGGDARSNRLLDEEVRKLITNKSPLFTYIPCSSYLSPLEFQYFVSRFKAYKVKKFLHFPVDVAYDSILLKEALRSDLIYLGGGNTFYFLATLRRRKLLPLLKEFVHRGGVLAGLSAGAIMMSQTIDMAAMPSFDRDENAENLKDLDALGLVEFDFFPHYRNSSRYDQEFMKFTKESGRPLYACPDGAGLLLDGSKITFVGPTWLFFQGYKVDLNE